MFSPQFIGAWSSVVTDVNRDGLTGRSTCVYSAVIKDRMTRTAVVTGGGTGIGRAVAARLAEQGLDVVITGRREDVLKAAAEEIGARAVVFDAADPDAVQAALSDLPSSVDVLVNNAGGNMTRR